MVAGNFAAPLYSKIKDHIVNLIETGELNAGERIPSESSLVKEFGVSRMTAHRALKELKEQGLVVRVSGVGTFVAEPKSRGHLITVNNIAEEVRGRGHDYCALVEKNERMKAEPEIAMQLGVISGTEVFHSIVVHKENNIPVVLEDRYVLASALPEYGDVDFTHTTPNEYLMEKAPLQKVEHRVKAILPDSATQKWLSVDKLEPCLLLLRRTWSQRRIVSYALLTHPGSRYEFSDEFEP